MGRCIVKLDGHYLEWSTVVDAPVTYGMTLDELRDYINGEYGAEGLRELPARLARVEERGTSMHGDESADETMWLNRAGENETCLTRAQLADYYVKRKGRGKRPVGYRFRTDEEDSGWTFEAFCGAAEVQP